MFFVPERVTDGTNAVVSMSYPSLHDCQHGCFRTNTYREKNVLSFLELVLFMVGVMRVITAIPRLASGWCSAELHATRILCNSEFP